MKGRESGMPDEAYWDSFFQPEGILDRLLLTADLRNHPDRFDMSSRPSLP